ncbi:hypothetical protein ACQEV2_00190 [Streptomyces sp. CA-251387]|uniref:hypothetical protein n=1 Tax=Streptomyces sp. CA-251387 TaxID=3240064 RepID=UPI003D8EDE0C
MRQLHRRIRTRGRIVLLVYGLILGCVGLADVYRGLDFGARTVGAFLVIAAMAIVGSCSAALRPEMPVRWRRWAPLSADLAVGLVSGWIIFRVQSNFVLQPVLVVTAVVVTSALLLAACLIWGDAREIAEVPLSTQLPPSATSSDRQARSTVVAAVIAAVGALLAACLTIPQFWYSARYEPSNNPPVVQEEASIESIEMRADHAEITVEIKVENKGKTPVRMLTSLYEITGTSWILMPEDGRDRGLPYEDIVGGNYGSAARVSPNTLYSRPEHIQVGPVGEDYAWIGSDEVVQTTLLARAPRDLPFSVYRVSVDVAVARADRVEVESRPGRETPREIKTCDGVRIAEYRRPLAHRSAFDWLTESDRELVTYWVLGGGSGWESPWWPPFPWNGVSIQHADHDCSHVFEPDHDGLEDDAMVGWASTVAEAGRPQEAEDKP